MAHNVFIFPAGLYSRKKTIKFFPFYKKKNCAKRKIKFFLFFLLFFFPFLKAQYLIVGDSQSFYLEKSTKKAKIYAPYTKVGIGIKELNNIINDGISEEDMNAVKRYSFGEYQQFGQTVAALTNRYAQFFLKENYIELDKVADIINSLSVDDVVNLTKEFVNTGLWSFGELGNINSKDNKKAYDKFSKELFKEGK